MKIPLKSACPISSAMSGLPWRARRPLPKSWASCRIRIEDLKTAVSEACLNAMEHGNKEHPDKRVLVSMNYKDHVFSVSVMDQGEGMNDSLEIPKKPDIDKKIEMLEPHRGLGMFLIEQLVDQVEFNQVTKDGHMVRMVETDRMKLSEM